MELEGKVALVTGGARGIGRAIAIKLAEKGAVVAVSDLLDCTDTISFVQGKGRKGFSVRFDVSDYDEVGKGFEKVRNELGAIDILVNNAGITTNVATVRNMTKEAFDREVMINLGGVFNCVKHALDDMVQKKWGRIINMSSGAAELGGFGQAGYTASKAGILGLTKTVALEHAKDRITCNAILPGLINTDAATAIREDIRDRIKNRIPARQLGEPQDVAEAVAFLATPGAKYINGAQLFVSGGQELFTF